MREHLGGERFGAGMLRVRGCSGICGLRSRGPGVWRPWGRPRTQGGEGSVVPGPGEAGCLERAGREAVAVEWTVGEEGSGAGLPSEAVGCRACGHRVAACEGGEV